MHLTASESRPNLLDMKERQTFHMSCSDELVAVYKPDICDTISAVVVRLENVGLWVSRSALVPSLLVFYQDL